MIKPHYICLALSLVLISSADRGRADQSGFPYDSELLLDAAPIDASKRIPSMDVAPDGTIMLEMWCNRIEGQIIVAADTITVLTGRATDRQCPPARLRGDAELLAALARVTNWQRQGDTVLLIGPRTLRFRLPTN